MRPGSVLRAKRSHAYYTPEAPGDDSPKWLKAGEEVTLVEQADKPGFWKALHGGRCVEVLPGSCAFDEVRIAPCDQVKLWYEMAQLAEAI